MFEIPRCNIIKSSFRNCLYLCLYHVCLFFICYNLSITLFSEFSHLKCPEISLLNCFPGSGRVSWGYPSEDTDSCAGKFGDVWEHKFLCVPATQTSAWMGAWGPEQQYSGSAWGGFTGTSGWESWECPESTAQRQGLDSCFCFCSIPEWALFIQKITLMQQLVDLAAWPTEFTMTCKLFWDSVMELLHQIVHFNLICGCANVVTRIHRIRVASLKLSTNTLHDNAIKSGNWIFWSENLSHQSESEYNRALKVCIDTECDQININNTLPSICHLSQINPTGMSRFSFHVIPWIWSLGNTGQHWYWREQILYRINDKNIYSVSSPFTSSRETALSLPQTNPILSLSAGGL